MRSQRGIELTESGVGKLDRVIRLNGEKCDATSPATWETAYLWLEEIGALTRTDRIITVHESTPEPTPESMNVDELPSTDPRFRQAVEDAAVSDYFGPLLQGWLDHLATDWGFTPNQSQLQAVQRFFERHNLSPLQFDNFNKCRRALSDAGVFPQGMITEQTELRADGTPTGTPAVCTVTVISTGTQPFTRIQSDYEYI
jgi:hypothetical protein